VIPLEHALSIIEPWITAYGAFALFVAIYLESFGAPLPSESALFSASLLAARGDLSIVAVVIAGWSAAVLGDTTGYFIGRFGGRPLLMRFGPSIGLTKERLKFMALQMHRHGFVVVMLARFIWGLRQLNGLLAGSLSMPVIRFIPANSIGAALWVGVWVFGPYLVANWFGLPFHR